MPDGFASPGSATSRSLETLIAAARRDIGMRSLIADGATGRSPPRFRPPCAPSRSGKGS